MLTIDGYTTIGQIDIINDGADHEGYILLLADSTGALYRCDALGCICCSDAYDELTADNVRPVTGTFTELACDLFDNAHSNVDADDRLEAETAARDTLRAVVALSARAAELPA